MSASSDGTPAPTAMDRPSPSLPTEHGARPGAARSRGSRSTALLTTYVVFLFAVPSNLQWTPLGSLGKPSTLLGLCLLAWWLISLRRTRDSSGPALWSPATVFFLLFFVVVLVSYASAILRGQPYDQIGSITTSLLRVASWGGVLLVAADGIRTRADMVLMFRRLTITASILATLGFAQRVTGSTLLDWTAGIPGWSVEWGGAMDTKGGLLRVIGTSTHPLEFSSSMTALLPITTAYTAIAYETRARRRWLQVVPPAALVVLLVMTVSRSAIIGLVIALLVLLPFLPSAFRKVLLTTGALGVVAITIAYPRVIITTLTAFTGVAEDPSALSRTTALSRLPEFASSSPWYGAGLGSFLPRYYIFDNGWALMLIELGLLGVLAFGLMLVSGVGGSLRAAARCTDAEGRAFSGALASAVTATAILLAMFDGISFPIFVGTLFLVLGLGIAARRVFAPPSSTMTATRAAPVSVSD